MQKCFIPQSLRNYTCGTYYSLWRHIKYSRLCTYRRHLSPIAQKRLLDRITGRIKKTYSCALDLDNSLTVTSCRSKKEEKTHKNINSAFHCRKKCCEPQQFLIDDKSALCAQQYVFSTHECVAVILIFSATLTWIVSDFQKEIYSANFIHHSI